MTKRMTSLGIGAKTGKTDADVLADAHRLVDDYVVHLRRNRTGDDIVDTRELPALKEALVNAFRVVIATESRPFIRRQLVKAGMTLAQFQDNIGHRRTIRSAPKSAGAYVGKALNQQALSEFQEALNRLDEEKMRLGSIFQNAVKLAERRSL